VGVLIGDAVLNRFPAPRRKVSGPDIRPGLRRFGAAAAGCRGGAGRVTA